MIAGVNLRLLTVTASITETQGVRSGDVIRERLVKKSPIIVPTIISTSYMLYLFILVIFRGKIRLNRN